MTQQMQGNFVGFLGCMWFKEGLCDPKRYHWNKENNFNLAQVASTSFLWPALTRILTLFWIHCACNCSHWYITYYIWFCYQGGFCKNTLLCCFFLSQRKSLCHLNSNYLLFLSLSTGKKRRLTLIECPNDINTMIDLAKVADLVRICLLTASTMNDLSMWSLWMCRAPKLP